MEPASSAHAYYDSAVANYNLGHQDRALDHALKAIGLDPDHTVSLAEQLAGVICLDRGDDKAAVGHLRNYLRQVPPSTNVNSVKALLDEAEKRLATAVKN